MTLLVIIWLNRKFSRKLFVPTNTWALVTFWTSKYKKKKFKCVLSNVWNAWMICFLYTFFSNSKIKNLKKRFRSSFELPRFVCDSLQFTVVLFLMDGRDRPSNLPELLPTGYEARPGESASQLKCWIHETSISVNVSCSAVPNNPSMVQISGGFFWFEFLLNFYYFLYWSCHHYPPTPIILSSTFGRHLASPSWFAILFA